VAGRLAEAGLSVVEALDRLLPLDEPEAGGLLAEVFDREGIIVHTGARATRVSHDGEFTLEFDGARSTAERLLVATGRRSDLAALGVAAIGLDENARRGRAHRGAGARARPGRAHRNRPDRHVR
jgi:pyruvate/2-oxoglutarate dehydrogenase complex dihydrolipoamide dehydrogenase (E3) component